MGTGPRLLRAAKLGFGKWLQRRTERGEPEGKASPRMGSLPFFFPRRSVAVEPAGYSSPPGRGFPGARAAGAAAAGGVPGPLAL